ncbi:hypothetical protein ACO0RG_004754 [Hanseniaspora osmophila]|uniref:Glycine cleavage system H protein n=1 Tax=Hanseniaspora osmophila TaxID=56408 RepID=A0A1E5RZD1_9ASCO|nr:Glycine cleavage system H protein, mitochondrial [Hanseniaspora osmophila]
MLRLQSPFLKNTVSLFQRSVRFNSTTIGNGLTKTELPYTFTASGPIQVKYTPQHEWLAIHPNNIAFIGITRYAAVALGDATYIELPEVDSSLEIGESFGSVESVKSASEIYSPVKGTVLDVNGELQDKPQMINHDPMGQGWLVKVNFEELEREDHLLDLERYEASLKNDTY